MERMVEGFTILISTRVQSRGEQLHECQNYIYIYIVHLTQNLSIETSTFAHLVSGLPGMKGPGPIVGRRDTLCMGGAASVFCCLLPCRPPGGGGGGGAGPATPQYRRAYRGPGARGPGGSGRGGTPCPELGGH